MTTSTLPSPSILRQARLRYTTDQEPGIRRLGSKGRFRYRRDDNRPVTGRDRERIQTLAIPPAWTDVWICASENGHLQATGRDVKGRKQSRYHGRWRETRDAAKYDRLAAFGKVLPALRRRLAADLALDGLPRRKVVATIIRLIEATHVRVGNEEYAKQNGSVGLTTMRDRHVNAAGGTLRFEFIGKSGVKHRVGVRDKRLTRIVRQCQDIPGQKLFQYYDSEGKRHGITSNDVNRYLGEVTGDHFTAKDFRTWNGTVLAFQLLNDLAPSATQTEANRGINDVVQKVAAELGNTRAVCRKFYIHPSVINAYVERSAEGRCGDGGAPCRGSGLRKSEQALLKLLRRRSR